MSEPDDAGRDPAGEERRFELRPRDTASRRGRASSPEAATRRKQRTRLPATLREIAVCLDDAAAIVRLGRASFDADMLAQRAAKNLVAELSETIGRLPNGYTRKRPGVAWQQLTGMRNRVIHAYERTDLDLLWNAVASDFPAVRQALGL